MNEIGARRNAAGECSWRLWAPLAKTVQLVLYDGDRTSATHAMAARADGVFEAVLANIPEGQRYAFQLDGREPRPDPAPRWQPDGVHAPSAVWSPNSTIGRMPIGREFRLRNW